MGLVLARAEILNQASAAGLTHLGADEMVPILLVALIWSPLVNPASDIAFMQAELGEAVEHGEVYLRSATH